VAAIFTIVELYSTTKTALVDLIGRTLVERRAIFKKNLKKIIQNILKIKPLQTLYMQSNLRR